MDLTTGVDLRVLDHTEILRPSLCPELQIRALDRNSPLGRAIRRSGLYAVHESFDGLMFPPHWGYAFAGGQALARYVLDHPALVAGRSVLDIGTGSGLAAIAAARAGASAVVAIDRDPVAVEAARNNASLNGVSVDTKVAEVVSLATAGCEVVLASEVFYEDDGIVRWLERHGVDATVVLADPGRGILVPEQVTELARYRVRTEPDLEWFEQAVVYQLASMAHHHRSV